MTTFLLIRHGANDYLDRALAGRLPGVSLNAEGRRQAEELGQQLAGTEIAHVYTSPQERARQTAEPLARRLGIAPVVAQELAEIDFGEWTGLALEQLEALPAWQEMHRLRSCTAAPGGETMLQVQARLVGLLARLTGLHPGQTVALFSHADPIKAVLCFYLGMSIDLMGRLEISPASVTALGLGPGGPRVGYVNRHAPVGHGPGDSGPSQATQGGRTKDG